MDKLTVLITTFNRLDYSKRTIESLLPTLPIKTPVIVWDNNSTEAGMKEYLTSLGQSVDPELHPIHVMLSSKNLGWGESVNQMLKFVDTPYVLISNNDVIYQAGWYEKLLDLYSKYPQVGVMGVWKHMAGHTVTADNGELVQMTDMPGVGWLMRMQTINDIGPFKDVGPCPTKGGCGDDSNYTTRALQKEYWVAAPKEDVAQHIDGY